MKRALMILTILVFASVFAQAQDSSVPELINYQGKLTDENGNPLEGEHELEFNIWDQASDGTEPLWGPQTFERVQVIQGHFNVILGPRDLLERSIVGAFADSERYLEIRVDGDAISPRQQILSAPFAIGSEHATHADSATNADSASLATHHSNIIPIGSIMPFFGIQEPRGWLMCDGREIDKGQNPEHADLVDYLRDENKVGSTDYQGDVSNEALLPDLRGIFLRGLNDFGTLLKDRSDLKQDPDGAERNLGSDQKDEFAKHNHDRGEYKYLLSRDGHMTVLKLSWDDTASEPNLRWIEEIKAQGGKETRPRNLAVTYIIKY